MFSLIITIISIALVAALALATIYYGGTAFSSGNVKATASQIVSQGQQISAAITLYKNDHGGTAPSTMADLTTGGYLQSAPNVSAGTWGILSGVPYLTGSLTSLSTGVCTELNTQVGATLAHTFTAGTPQTTVQMTTAYACGDDSAGSPTARYFQYGH